MASGHDAPIDQSDAYAGEDVEAGDHGHDDHHGDHATGGDAWVLVPIAVGLVIGLVLALIFGLASGVASIV